MNRIIITGATGMIGANLARYAESQQCRVLCIIRPGSSKESNIPRSDNVDILYAELSDYKNIKPDGEYDIFFHLAWEKTFGASRDDVDSQFQNIGYTLDAVRLAHRFGCRVFVGAGSQAEYGTVGTVLKPDTPVNPLSGYGIAKYSAGKLSGLLCSQLGIRHNWVRILSVYGTLDSPQTLIMYAINSLLKGVKPSFTKCEQIWDYINEYDAAAALYSIGVKGVDQRVYPLGSGSKRKLFLYLQEIRDIIAPGIQLGFGEKDYYPNQPMYLCADISSITADTGWVPCVGFEEGVRRIVSSMSQGK